MSFKILFLTLVEDRHSMAIFTCTCFIQIILLAQPLRVLLCLDNFRIGLLRLQKE